ncbi:hypothetical protein HDU79_002171 [Rhizoclosmatium sp. JEL0117]|nr:hypothetical protein HDU79_002171 [Rhizoclosmatium sp. JEL0117]
MSLSISVTVVTVSSAPPSAASHVASAVEEYAVTQRFFGASVLVEQAQVGTIGEVVPLLTAPPKPSNPSNPSKAASKPSRRVVVLSAGSVDATLFLSAILKAVSAASTPESEAVEIVLVADAAVAVAVGSKQNSKGPRLAVGLAVVCAPNDLAAAMQNLARTQLRLRTCQLHMGGAWTSSAPLVLWARKMLSVKHGLPNINNPADSLNLHFVRPLHKPELTVKRGIDDLLNLEEECDHLVLSVSDSTPTISDFFQSLNTLTLLLTSDKDSLVPTHKLSLTSSGLLLSCLPSLSSTSIRIFPSSTTTSSVSKRAKLEDSIDAQPVKSEGIEHYSLLQRVGWEHDVLTFFAPFISLFQSPQRSDVAPEAFSKVLHTFRILSTLIKTDNTASSLFPGTPLEQDRTILVHHLITNLLSITSTSTLPYAPAIHAEAVARLSEFVAGFQNTTWRISRPIVKSLDTPLSKLPVKEGAHLVKGPKRTAIDPRMVPSYLKVPPAGPLPPVAKRDTLWDRYVRDRGGIAKDAAGAKKISEMENIRVAGMNLEIAGGEKVGGGFGGGKLVPMAFD